MKNKLTLSILVFLIALVGIATVNADPVFTTTALDTGTQGVAYSFNVLHTAADSGSATYALESVSPAAPGLMFANGILSWNSPTIGTYTVTLNVSDDNSSDIQAFTLTISQGTRIFGAADAQIGSDNQEREEISTGTWVVTNTGTVAISNIVVSTNGDDEYNITAEAPQTVLQAGESMSVIVSAYVPDDQDSGEDSIGTITVQGDSATTLIKDVVLTTVSKLVISEIDVNVDGSRNNLEKPGTVDDEANLGDEIEIEVEIENTFTNSEDIEIDDVELTTNSGLDDADDLDDDISVIEADDKETLTVSFFIDEEETDPQDAPFTITIKVTGEDDNGAKHTDEWDIRLDMDTQTRDLRIIDATPRSSQISCNEDYLIIDYTIRNIGRKDVSNGMVKFEATELDLGTWERGLEVDEGDTEDFSTSILLPDAKDRDSRSYFLDMTAYSSSSTSDDTDEEIIVFELNDCSDDTGSDDVTPPPSNNTPPTTNVTLPVATGQPLPPSPRDSSEDTFMIVMGVLLIILIIVVIVLIIQMAKKK